MGAPGEPLACSDARHAEHAQQPEAAVGQGVRDRLDERRQLVGRVVVDEDDLVGGVGQDLREAVQAERGAPVEVVSVRVVAPVHDHRDHGRLPAIAASRLNADRDGATETARRRRQLVVDPRVRLLQPRRERRARLPAEVLAIRVLSELRPRTPFGASSA